MEEPRIRLMALRSLPPDALVVRQSLLRVAMATEEPEEPEESTAEEWNRLISERIWPAMVESIERQGMRPDGEWAVIVDDREDWRGQLADSVVRQIEAAMASNPRIRVLGVAHLVDTAGISLLPPPDVN